MPLTNGSGSGSCSGSYYPDANEKLFFLRITYFLKVPIHLHHFSKIKSHKELTHKTGFSYYFCLMIEGSGSGFVDLTNGSRSGSRRPGKLMDPDPDPQHCFLLLGLCQQMSNVYGTYAKCLYSADFYLNYRGNDPDPSLFFNFFNSDPIFKS
jgi:hypothetical protein